MRTQRADLAECKQLPGNHDVCTKFSVTNYAVLSKCMLLLLYDCCIKVHLTCFSRDFAHFNIHFSAHLHSAC